MSQKRIICPKCQDPRKTVQITKENGHEWGKCFRDSCNYYINTDVNINYEDLTSKSEKDSKPRREPVLVSVRNHPKAWQYVTENGLESFLEYIKYDIKDDRIVFIQDDLLLGRSLDKEKQPKWYHYTLSKHPFIINKFRDGYLLLVEDIVSCMKASEHTDCMALLGTTFKEQYIPYIKGYSAIIVALDKDASKTAVKMQGYLSNITDTYVLFLDKDIKDMSSDNIKELINNKMQEVDNA